ncbi:hypothetical protein Tcan_01140, partial [Toxocara canis]
MTTWKEIPQTTFNTAIKQYYHALVTQYGYPMSQSKHSSITKITIEHINKCYNIACILSIPLGFLFLGLKYHLLLLLNLFHLPLAKPRRKRPVGFLHRFQIYAAFCVRLHLFNSLFLTFFCFHYCFSDSFGRKTSHSCLKTLQLSWFDPFTLYCAHFPLEL